MSTRLVATLRAAEAAAWAAHNPSNYNSTAAHELIREALNMALAAQSGARCGVPTCDDVVEYSGVGRPPIYCSRRCRDKAAYTARQKRLSN